MNNNITNSIRYIKEEGLIKLIFFILLKLKNYRKIYSLKYIKGNGIEIGAFGNPLYVDKTIANVKYVDYLPPDELKKINLGLKNENNVKIDYILKADNLIGIENNSQDFVIANHLFEHINNPIKALIEWDRVLKNDGILYLTIPDKRKTFDKNRERTTLQHIIEDFENPSEERDFNHYKDFAQITLKDSLENNIDNEISKLIKTNYSIHYHVYIEDDIIELINWCNNELLTNFKIIDRKSTTNNPTDNEFILILIKN